MPDDPDLSSYCPWVRAMILGWPEFQYQSCKEIAQAVLPKKYGSNPTLATENVRRRIGELVAHGVVAYDMDSGKDTSAQEVSDKIGATQARRRAKSVSYGSYLAHLITQEVQALPPISYPVVPELPTRAPTSVVLCLSDIQWGRWTDSFNNEVATIRLEKMLAETCKLVKSTKAEEVVILFLGDEVDGEDIYGKQRFEITGPAVQQYMSLSQQLASLVMTLASKVRVVRCYGVVGNHGRIGEKDNNYLTSNWDYLVYHHVAQLCSQQSNVHWKIAEDFFDRLVVQDRSVLITHGDACGGGADGVASLRKSALKWSASMPFWWDICLIGHFHSPFWGAQNSKWLGICGTMLSGDEYAMRVIKEQTPPSQKLLTIRHGDPTIAVRDVVLGSA